jgi:pSer/pThr/pTyr-binding forkhead associated (FHA) protein
LAQVVVLKIYRGGQLVDEKQLDQDHIVMGSSASDSHVLLNGDASPIHASIEKRGDKYVICDLGSEKGTFKNSDKILEAELKSGDKLKLGEFIVEFYLQVPVGNVTTATSIHKIQQNNVTNPVQNVTQPINQQTTNVNKPSTGNQNPVQATQSTGSAQVTHVSANVTKSAYSKNTFAPQSPYKSVSDFIRPTKGTTVEVLVAWRERVISAYHFTENGPITAGTHPTCDVVVPLISSNVNKVPLIQVNNQVQIILYPGMQGTLVSEQQTTDFTQLAMIGRGTGQSVVLQQGEMARIQLGGDVEILIRYASQAPKPVIIPFLDLSSNGFLAVLLAIVLSGILSLWVALNKMDELDKMDEDEYRTALIITNPPKPPPQPKVQLPPPPKEPPPKKEIKIVKIEVEKKPEPKKVALDMTKTERKRVTKTPTAKAGENARAKGSGNDSSPRSMKPKEGKKDNQVSSVKKGGSIKTATKEGAQAQSERQLKKSGIFSAFGSGGRNNQIDNSYSGSGELAGLADQASGSAGFAEDRPGEGLGSKFKDTGAGGNGKSNVGVSGLTKGGTGLGAGGFGSGGLGDRKAVTIIPGGDGEEFSGQIDREGIRKVFFDNQRAIRSCYERELNQDPNLSGILKLNFDIGEHGRVVGSPSINWGDSSMKNRSVASCVLNRLKTWRFPEPPKNQVVNVIYPLAFAAK